MKNRSFLAFGKLTTFGVSQAASAGSRGGNDIRADGARAPDEIEALHMSANRDRMVDGFQHLDADGDGQITQQKMNTTTTRVDSMHY